MPPGTIPSSPSLEVPRSTFDSFSEKGYAPCRWITADTQNATCDEIGAPPSAASRTLANHLQHAMKKYSPKHAGCGFCGRVAKKTLPPNTFQPQDLAGVPYIDRANRLGNTLVHDRQPAAILTISFASAGMVLIKTFTPIVSGFAKCLALLYRPPA